MNKWYVVGRALLGGGIFKEYIFEDQAREFLKIISSLQDAFLEKPDSIAFSEVAWHNKEYKNIAELVHGDLNKAIKKAKKYGWITIKNKKNEVVELRFIPRNEVEK